MNRHAIGSKWLLTLGALVLIAVVAIPALAANYTPKQELDRIRENLQDVVTLLAQKDRLNGEELNNTRRELAIIYRDLEALSKRMADGTSTPSQPADDWQPYSSAAHDITPSGAQWKGWQRSADISFDLGSAGEIVLRVSNGNYRAVWTIQNAYAGGAEARVNAKANGDVVLSVTDNNGKHEFKVELGGLGELFVRGRQGAGTVVTKSASGQ